MRTEYPWTNGRTAASSLMTRRRVSVAQPMTGLEADDMRRLLSALLGASLLLGSAGAVLAGGKPTIEPVPFPEEGILLPGGVFCDVDVFVEAIKNTEKALTFPADADGNVLQIITGQLWITATNVATGDSVVLNISGPYKLLIRPDGTLDITFFGRSVPVQPPGFIVTSGRVDYVIHPDGSSEILSQRGGSTDVCALLGA